MEINVTVEGGQAELAVAGWLDTQTAPELAAALEALPAEVGALTLNLAQLEYISSAGLRQVVAAHKKMGGNLTLTNVSAEILDVFKMTGFDKHLNIA